MFDPGIQKLWQIFFLVITQSFYVLENIFIVAVPPKLAKIIGGF